MPYNSIRVLDVIARILMAALFIYSGFGKLMDPSVVSGRLAGLGFPLPGVAAYVAIAIEIGGAALLIYGFRLLEVAAILAAYTVIVTFMFHNFWAVPDAAKVGQTIQFLKNCCILSGLWFIARTTLVETTDKSAENAI